ncbi:MAG: hypothetical protein HYW88_03125 [Candidatus Sungbacteria bacterium]|nr:hypothetical protein [Candidatus Sungbacteria bacterium]
MKTAEIGIHINQQPNVLCTPNRQGEFSMPFLLFLIFILLGLILLSIGSVYDLLKKILEELKKLNENK